MQFGLFFQKKIKKYESFSEELSQLDNQLKLFLKNNQVKKELSKYSLKKKKTDMSLSYDLRNPYKSSLNQELKNKGNKIYYRYERILEKMEEEMLSLNNMRKNILIGINDETVECLLIHNNLELEETDNALFLLILKWKSLYQSYSFKFFDQEKQQEAILMDVFRISF